jgi:hypothetical protein
VIFCENFEARAVGPVVQTVVDPIYKNNGWGPYDYSCLRVTDNPAGIFDGNRAFETAYTEGPTTGCAGMYAIFPGGPYTNLYMRWYTKYSDNFVWSQIANKIMQWMNGVGALAGHLGGIHCTGCPMVMDIGLNTAGWALPGTDGCPPDCELLPNENGGITYQAGVWYCEEVHLQMNTCATCADGLVEKWIAVASDPTQVRHWNYPNVIVNGGGNQWDQQVSGINSDSFWNCNATDVFNNGVCSPGTSSTHPLQYRWHDNFVASTQRIGCLGG